MAKQAIHNEWFQPIKRTKCDCGAKRTEVVSWGEYVRGKWRTVGYVCQACVATGLIPRLQGHAADCGCAFAFKARSGYMLPGWLKAAATTLNAESEACVASGQCAA